MRHQKAGRKFGRKSAHRHAMYHNLVTSLLVHERIETTEAKAKEIRRLAERTIAWGASVSALTEKGRDTLTADEKAEIVHAIRMAGRVVTTKEALDKLFAEIGPRFKGRPGGYTRILKTRVRMGDAAPMSFIELVPVADAKSAKAPATTKKATGQTKTKATAPTESSP